MHSLCIYTGKDFLGPVIRQLFWSTSVHCPVGQCTVLVSICSQLRHCSQGHLEGVFRAMAVLMLEQESAREQFMASEALPAVIAALGA